MKSISIYTITRNQNIEQLQKLERQLSGRDYFLKMREWELESMKALTAELETCMEDVYALRFFYSFQIPRLGKEFDLLQIEGRDAEQRRPPYRDILKAKPFSYRLNNFLKCTMPHLHRLYRKMRGYGE